jgi:hypothetical protein
MTIQTLRRPFKHLYLISDRNPKEVEIGIQLVAFH